MLVGGKPYTPSPIAQLFTIRLILATHRDEMKFDLIAWGQLPSLEWRKGPVHIV